MGTVITYTVDDDEVLTIKDVLKTHNDLKDGYVQAGKVSNGDYVYMAANSNSVGNVATSKTNMQWTLEKTYDNGDASVYLDDGKGNDDVKYAIDRNTVAFYYVDDDNYGVATGWDHMGKVEADGDVGVQVYPVMTKDPSTKSEVPTNLAEVILFNAETTASSRDYMLVLNRNAYTASDELWLNVVFEDGTTKEIQIDDNDSTADFDDKDDFMKAYAYVENSDGTYDIASVKAIDKETSTLLKKGTVDVAGEYYALPDNANVWDVNDVDSATRLVSTASTSVSMLVTLLPTPAP